MLRWAAVFFILMIITGILGFGGLLAVYSGIATLLFYLFCVVFLVFVLAGIVRGRRPQG
jgi:uncharacterized membrane protein YtjA (UPF0391 family)